MKPVLRLASYGLIMVTLVLLAAPPSFGEIIHWPDTAQHRQDLFLLGFGELTMHVLNVDGNVQEFENANPNYKKDFSTDYRMSMFANGNVTKGLLINGAAILDSRIDDEYRTIDPNEFRLRMSAESTEPIWDGWRFTGHGVYDPARQWEVANLDKRLLTQPQEPSRLELLMRLESEENGYIEGGSIHPTFENAEFTLKNRSVFGVYADLHNEDVGVEAVGGKLEGKKFREGAVEGIRADGTSGPYDLSHAPITRGSEEVRIETRDRYNETTVLSTATLVRDIDYTVDYVLGRILLNQPVASETISGDPIYIVITADYWREDSDDIVGGRGKVTAIENVQVSGSYLHRIIDDRTAGAGIDEPEDLFAGDASFSINEHTNGYVEVAGSQNEDLDETNDAIRAGVETKAVENLTLKADFLRVEDQFRSFTNSSLDPNKNQQRLHFGGEYQLDSSSALTASYTDIQGIEANGEYNTYDGRRDEKIISAGYRNDLKSTFGFGVRGERRNIKDLDNDLHEDNYINRAIVDVGGVFEDVSILGKLGYKAGYELEMFRNELNIGRNDANTNQFTASLTSKPTDRTSIEVGQRFSLRKDKVLDLYDERWDASFGTLQWRLHDNVNTMTTYEYKRKTAPGTSVSLWQDDPLATERAGTFAIEYLPLNKIKALGKVGRHDSRSWYDATPMRTCNDFAMAQATYFYTHHWSFDMETEYQWKARYFAEHERYRIWDLTLKTNWNRDRLNEFTIGMIRRWQKEDLTESCSYILLASGSASLTRYIFARGSVKETLLNDPLDDEKMFTRLEVGYDSNDWFRVSLGYERISNDVEDDPGREYTGQGVFVRFSGKM